MTTTKATHYTIRCDDRRYCAGGGIVIIPANTRRIAHMQARQKGWKIPYDGLSQCPACVIRKHPRRDN